LFNNSKLGTASLYGISFEDQLEYDYLQHLKPMGEDPSAVFIPSGPVKVEKEGILFKVCITFLSFGF